MRQIIKRLSLVVIAGCMVGGGSVLAQSRPLIIEETSRIYPPDAIYERFGRRLAIDGDEAMIADHRSYSDQSGEGELTRIHLFRRTGNNWTHVRQIAEDINPNGSPGPYTHSLAMRDGVAALALAPFRLFERRNGDWVETTFFGIDGTPNQVNDEGGVDVEMDGGRIFYGGHNWGGSVFEKDAAGVWRVRQNLFGDSDHPMPEEQGAPVDISPNFAVVADPAFGAEGVPAPAVHIFRNKGTAGWLLDTRMTPPEGHYFGEVALRGAAAERAEQLFIEDLARYGVARYERQPDGAWRVGDWLRTAGDLRSDAGFFTLKPHGTGLKKSGPYVFHRAWNADRHNWVVNVFQPDKSGFHQHVATLAASNDERLGEFISVSGQRVLVGGFEQVFYFELPATFATPAVIEDTFASGNGMGWSTLAGSRFAVVQSGITRVYRQSSTAGNAAAVLDAANWANQSIQVDVKASRFNGADRWFGLATRRTDSANFYCVMMRSTGVVSLRRMLNGVLVPLANASYPVTLNRNYRLRLESIGTAHRVYVDGVLVLDADDDTLASGRPALLTYRTAADFDNVVVSPTPTATMWTQNLPTYDSPGGANEAPWSYDGPGTWTWIQDELWNDVLEQPVITGIAHAAVGPEPWTLDLRDQVVEVRARARTFGAGVGPGSPGFGVMAQFKNPNNYVYLTIRNSNTISLRKRVKGTSVRLGEVVQPVVPGAWYRLRLETVGTSVRAYVDGRLVIEAVNPQPNIGRSGVVTLNTAAEFDDFVAVQP